MNVECFCNYMVFWGSECRFMWSLCFPPINQTAGLAAFWCWCISFSVVPLFCIAVISIEVIGQHFYSIFVFTAAWMDSVFYFVCELQLDRTKHVQTCHKCCGSGDRLLGGSWFVTVCSLTLLSSSHFSVSFFRIGFPLPVSMCDQLS